DSDEMEYYSKISWQSSSGMWPKCPMVAGSGKPSDLIKQYRFEDIKWDAPLEYHTPDKVPEVTLIPLPHGTNELRDYILYTCKDFLRLSCAIPQDVVNMNRDLYPSDNTNVIRGNYQIHVNKAAECDCGGPEGHVPNGFYCRK